MKTESKSDGKWVLVMIAALLFAMVFFGCGGEQNNNLNTSQKTEPEPNGDDSPVDVDPGIDLPIPSAVFYDEVGDLGNYYHQVMLNNHQPLSLGSILFPNNYYNSVYSYHALLKSTAEKDVWFYPVYEEKNVFGMIFLYTAAGNTKHRF